jgi:3-oxoacyl-[acyl-carrier-protein] synthase I
VSYYLPSLGIVNALGAGVDQVHARLLAGATDGMLEHGPLLSGRSTRVGRVQQELPLIPEALIEFDCRNNRLLLAAFNQIKSAVEGVLETHGPDRVAVLIGTSTSGISEGERAAVVLHASGAMPPDFSYRQQEIGNPAEFLARAIGARGPRYTVSTACSSSAKVFASAKRLLDADLCDAVVLGGGDSLCELTVNGFDALESVAAALCNPFSRDRDGINIGEGAALFLMGRDPAAVRFLGVGEASDAHHMSAPDPEGGGALRAMRRALEDSDCDSDTIGYVNLHGTATRLNDAMESRVMNELFGGHTPCSSTKPQIGHTLGAAGAQEAGFCWMLLQDEQRRLPAQIWDGGADPDLPPIGLTAADTRWDRGVFMSNSYAFGGSNVSLVLGL